MEQKMPKDSNQTAMCSPHIVLSELLRICEEEDIIYAVLNAFMEDAPTIFQNLDQALVTKDCSQIALYTHRMKGSARNIGAMELSAMALKMELKAKENKLESMTEDYAELKRLYGLLKAFVSTENWLSELRRANGEV
jgi:HPt (histidine-containing phosphotransfer) domain-containing protein